MSNKGRQDKKVTVCVDKGKRFVWTYIEGVPRTNTTTNTTCGSMLVFVVSFKLETRLHESSN